MDVSGVEGESGKAVRDVRHTDVDQVMVGQGVEEREPDDGQEHSGGGRFNRKLVYLVAGVLMMAGVVAVHGIRSAGVTAQNADAARSEDAGDAARDKAEVEALAADAARPKPPPVVMPAPAPAVPRAQAQVEQHTARPPSRYAQWAEDKYMRALEAPQMVAAFHGGSTLEIGNARGEQGGSAAASLTSSSDPNVTLHPPASPYTVMSGSVIPAVMVSGINSDLPGPILAQVSQNVFDSATGKSLLIPQGSRLLGVYRNASSYGQQRVQISFQRLIFPDTSSMNLPQMPGGDQGGYAGFSDRVNNHYAATFGTAALMSLISAGQMVGQMAAFGGGGTYGPYAPWRPSYPCASRKNAGRDP